MPVRIETASVYGSLNRIQVPNAPALKILQAQQINDHEFLSPNCMAQRMIFILTWKQDTPTEQLTQVAQRICARTTGIGADGWMLVEREGDGLRTRLFNSDGSEPEISGNGTRCAAAFGLSHRSSRAARFHCQTAAGPKRCVLSLMPRLRYDFEMDMGQPKVQDVRTAIQLGGVTYDATVLTWVIRSVPSSSRDSCSVASGRSGGRSSSSFPQTIKHLFRARHRPSLR